MLQIIKVFWCFCPCFEVHLWFCPCFFLTLWFMILPFTFHKSMWFCPWSLRIGPCFDRWIGVKSYWLVNSKEQNHKVKKMRAKSQLNLKGGARTQIRHVADSAVDVFFSEHEVRLHIFILRRWKEGGKEPVQSQKKSFMVCSVFQLYLLEYKWIVHLSPISLSFWVELVGAYNSIVLSTELI